MMQERETPSAGSRGRGLLLLFAVMGLLFVYLFPILYMGITAFKPAGEIYSLEPKFLFKPDPYGFVEAFTTRRLAISEPISEEEKAREPWYQKMAVAHGNPIIGSSGLHRNFLNSFLIAGLSTVLAVAFGTFAAYGFSRFKIPGEKDWLFFILSTRMLPPMALVIPLYLMYSKLHLLDTRFGLILLYLAFNVSLSTWLMKGFIDEIPKEYEEAAWVDGYSRLQAFFKIVLPQAATGIAATAVFCFIFTWNEYVFALVLSPSGEFQTVPIFLPGLSSSGRVEWEAIASGALLFMLPVVLLTFFLRKHLLRGITFGAIRK